MGAVEQVGVDHTEEGRDNAEARNELFPSLEEVEQHAPCAVRKKDRRGPVVSSIVEGEQGLDGYHAQTLKTHV